MKCSGTSSHAADPLTSTAVGQSAEVHADKAVTAAANAFEFEFDGTSRPALSLISFVVVRSLLSQFYLCAQEHAFSQGWRSKTTSKCDRPPSGSP